MRLGFYTNYSPEIAKFAERVGFRSMELSAWPSSALNAENTSDETIRQIRSDLEARDIEISSLGYYPNYFDPKKGSKAQAYFLKVLELAERMGVPTVCTFAGRDPDKSVADNIPLFKEVFTKFCEQAEKRNLRIGIENCPMMDRIHMEGENIAFSPEIWDEMFRAVPSDHLGLELDPAHMVWLGIDYIQAVYDYGEKIFHVHAKDMEIRKNVLSRVGIYGSCFDEVFGLGHGWWRARTPGWGEVKWTEFLSALMEVGYEGNVDIEHEDDVFAQQNAMSDGDEEADIVATYGTEKIGLVLGYKTLSKFFPKE